MNTEAIITAVRNLIANGTTLALTDVYTPELPQEKENICAVTLLGGLPHYDLCGLQMFDLTLRVLIRGTQNDTSTRALADDIFNAVNSAQDITAGTSNIIQILATTTPVFVGKDEQLRNLYNITFNLKGE